MQGGKSGMALHHLTGFPSTDFLHENMDQLQASNGVGAEGLFERMEAADKLGFSIGCGTGGHGEFEIDNSGIIAGHAYTLLSAHRIKDRNGKDQKLVNLRNPWGKFEFKGDYNDKDNYNWTQALKDQVKWKDEDDG